MNDKDYILQINNGRFGYLHHRKEKVLLKQVSLNLRRGELVCLVGRNGSGKSTLLKTLMKLSPLLGGEIILEGKNFHHFPVTELARICSFVPTALTNTGEMTVQELVELGRYPYTSWYGTLTSRDHAMVDDALIAAGLSSMAGSKLQEISDGEKQRAMIARSLAQNTPLILLDEPSAFLDIPGKYGITSLLRQLCRQQHSAVFSTHDLNLALQYADKIWLIADEGIIQGAPEDLIINDRIRNLFHSDQIWFDLREGEFKPVVAYRGKVSIQNLKALPEVTEWTRRALQRAGFSSKSTGNDDPQVVIDQIGEQLVWILKTPDRETVCESIYDLLLEMEQL